MSYMRSPSAVGWDWGDLMDAAVSFHTPSIDPVEIRGRAGVSTGSGVALPTATTTVSPFAKPDEAKPPAAAATPFYKNPIVIVAALAGVYLYTRRRR